MHGVKSMDPIKTSEVLSAVRVRQKTRAGHMHVIIAVDPKFGRELEVFAQVGKAGGLPMGNLEAICRMVSLFLRVGGDLGEVIEQLKGIGSSGEETVPSVDGPVLGLGDALGKGLQRYLDAKTKYGLTAILEGEIDPEKDAIDASRDPDAPWKDNCGDTGVVGFYKGRPVVRSIDPKDFPYPPEPDIPQTMPVREAVVNLKSMIDRGFGEMLVEFRFVVEERGE